MFKGIAKQEWVRVSVVLYQGRICLSVLIQSLSQRRVCSSKPGLALPALAASSKAS